MCEIRNNYHLNAKVTQKKNLTGFSEKGSNPKSSCVNVSSLWIGETLLLETSDSTCLYKLKCDISLLLLVPNSFEEDKCVVCFFNTCYY